MTKALEHFLPNIDLNLQSLKEVVRSIGSVPDGQSLAMSDAGDGINAKDSQHGKLEGGAMVSSTVTIEEIDALHGELGWLRVDSKGTYRKWRPAAALHAQIRYDLCSDRTCRRRLWLWI